MTKIIIYKDSDGMTQIAHDSSEITSRYTGSSAPAHQKKAVPIRVQSLETKENIKKEAIKRLGKAVVMVLVDEGTGDEGATGIIVSPEGYVLTNQHVIAGATKFIVRLPKQTEEFDMVIHGVNQYYDLALLKPVKPAGVSLPFIVFGNSGQVVQGDEILVLGYPYLDYDKPSSVDGSISLIRDSEGTFQLNCSLNPGNSGGPLISLVNGEVVGLITAKHRGSEGMGYAIKSQIAQEFLIQMGVAQRF